MSGLRNSSINGIDSNLQDSSGRSFATSFSAQAGAASPAFNPTGTIQGLHNIDVGYNFPNMPNTLTSRNLMLNSNQASTVQQPNISLSNGRFASNNLPLGISQLSHVNSHGQFGVTNRGIGLVGNTGYSSSTNGVGGFIPRIFPTSAATGNRNTVPALDVSQNFVNTGSRFTNSMVNMVGGGNINRSINSGEGLSIPGLASHLDSTASIGSGNMNIHNQNRFMSGVLPQGSSQVISHLRNSYSTAGGPLSQSHANNLSSIGNMRDMNFSDGIPFDINNDFPQLTSRPSSSGGPQGQLGSLQKQGLSTIAQQNQEFSIQNEDFPALPGFRGNSIEYAMDVHPKEQLLENTMSMMQTQHLSMGGSGGLNLAGTFSSHHPQKQQHVPGVGNSGVSYPSVNNIDHHHLHGSDIFSITHPTYHSQTSSQPGIKGGPLSSFTNTGFNYDQLTKQYPQHQNQPQFHFPITNVSQPLRDPDMKSMQAREQSNPDRFGLLGLVKVIRGIDPGVTILALGIDLTTLGLNLNSSENVHKTFGSPWSEEPVTGEPQFVVPQCYNDKLPAPLQKSWFAKCSTELLMYIFYSMPKDVAQLYAANELYNKGWFYHKEHKTWYTKVAEPLVKSNTDERGSYRCFDPNTFSFILKDNFVLQYEMVEKRPTDFTVV